MKNGLTALLLLFTGCLREAVVPSEPLVPLADPGRLVSPELTDGEYLHGAPRCYEYGQQCWTDEQYEQHLRECQELGGVYIRTCEEDVKNHLIWCLHFRYTFDAACSVVRPGDPNGPFAICLKTCHQTEQTMEQYNCWDQKISCVSHAGFWERLCARSCWTEQDGL